MNYRYVRIQGREDSYVTGRPKGVFSLCWNLIRDGIMSAEDETHFREIDGWYKVHLPEPQPCRDHEKVITYFKTDAGEMLDKAEEMLTLLEQYKKPYDVVYTNFAESVVYEDEWQIAVKIPE